MLSYTAVSQLRHTGEKIDMGKSSAVKPQVVSECRSQHAGNPRSPLFPGWRNVAALRLPVKRGKLMAALILIGILLCLWLLAEAGLFLIRQKGGELAQYIDSPVEDVLFERIMFTFYNDARGVVLVYRIENNTYHSRAYWFPFRSEPFEVFK